MLQVRNISKTYPGENLGAVNDVSLNVDRGEIISIIGQSGCGKTTLLRIIAGLMKPDDGSVSINGEGLLNPEEQLIAGHSAIKMVFQNYDLKPNMTVEENIGYMLLDYDSTYKSEKTAQLLELCGLAQFRNREPRELSGGQQQRLSLARALADEPDLLLMDEPFSNIDPISKRNLLLEIERITKELEVAIVFVSHDTQDALMISDRVGFMQEGQLLEINTPEGLYKHPKSLSAAKFLGILNQFDVQELLTFGIKDIPPKKSIGVIRAEALELNTEGFQPVTITECKFLGPAFLIKSLSERGRELHHISANKIEIGASRFINILKEDIIYF
jgi:iron(III) transport system ATP-binding protein